MCGIVGILNKRPQSPDGAVLRRMRDIVSYRGPDAAGEYISGPIALGHRRLAVIDIAGGAQPMSTPDGKFTIVYNGEIYNYQQLRAPLASKYQFRTNSDTEVLLYHLIEHGPQGIPLLNGMFAFALWDADAEKLLLARDRFGKKPLFYAQTKDVFVFASEIKSILQHPAIDSTLDPAALVRYFVYEYVPGPNTAFASIQKLPSGSWMKATRDTAKVGSWWQLKTAVDDFSLPITDATDQFDRLLDAAVSARMVADVPVGVLLSGGIDSSTIAWYMRQHAEHVHSFSVSFPEESFNEAPYASLAARALGTTHHDIRFDLDAFEHTRVAAIERLDEPLADASLLPTLLVSQQAKQHVTVVLDGDGADELLYGYGTFCAYATSRWYEKIPATARAALEHAITRLPPRYTNFSFDFKLKSFIRGMPYSAGIRNQVWLGSFHNHELEYLLTPELRTYLHDLYQPTADLEQKFNTYTPLEQLSLTYLSHYLQEDILVKIDRATMYASLEARTPFLDPRLVSFVLKLPLHEKYRACQGKRILKRVMRGRLPPDIITRKKQGFGIPLGAWLRGPLKPLLHSTLSPERITATGIINPVAVTQLIEEHLSGIADHRKKLWTLLIFQWWWERWVNPTRL